MPTKFNQVIAVIESMRADGKCLPGQDLERGIVEVGVSASTVRRWERAGLVRDIGHRVLTLKGHSSRG